MPFAQLVIGAPGAGKSTYCDGMHQFLNAIGRKSSVVNLDPANEKTSYPCALDVRGLVTLEEMMGARKKIQHGVGDANAEGGQESQDGMADNEGVDMDDGLLGPNGGILFALEELEENFEWLEERLKKLGKDEYILFDCPGQVELFTHHDSLRRIFRRLEKMGYRVCLSLFNLLLPIPLLPFDIPFKTVAITP